MSETTPTDPTLITAAALRKAKTWIYELAAGLGIKCRHLSMHGFMIAGTLPTGVMDTLMTRWATTTIAGAMTDPEKRRDLVSVACAYACAAAVEPRIVMDTDDPVADGSAIVISLDPVVTELPHDELISLMNEGMARRIGNDAARVVEFSRTQSQSGAADRSHGDTVQPSPELVAAGGSDRPH